MYIVVRSVCDNSREDKCLCILWLEVCVMGRREGKCLFFVVRRVCSG